MKKWKVKIFQNPLATLLLDILSIGKKIKIDGFTFLNYVLIRKGKLTEELLAHELVHVDQWRRFGFFKFSYKYIKYLFQFGYWLNPLEIEAYKYQNNKAYLNWALTIMGTK